MLLAYYLSGFGLLFKDSFYFFDDGLVAGDNREVE